MLLDTALDLKFQVQEQVYKDYDRQVKEAGMLTEFASDKQLLMELKNRNIPFFIFMS